MEFCQRCGGVILVQDKKANCVSCGYRLKKAPKIQVAEKIPKKEDIAVINEEAESTYPVIDMDCPKCKHKKAHFWSMQTRSSDESETKFYKCVKCKHTWRIYR
jgi:DNA-directed RNA polymerase subunit M